MEEQWKPIRGFEGKYLISNKGNVMSCTTGQLMTPQLNKGYLIVGLYDGNHKKYHHILVHRIVAHAFIPKPKGFNEVNHINEDKMDNRVENLEWTDRLGNMTKFYDKHPERKKGYQKPRGKRTNTKYYHKEVIQYDLQGNEIKRWKDVATIEHQINFHGSSIVGCCFGKRHTAYGYKWQFAIGIQDNL